MVENRIFKLSTNAAIRFKKLLGKGDFGLPTMTLKQLNVIHCIMSFNFNSYVVCGISTDVQRSKVNQYRQLLMP